VTAEFNTVMDEYYREAVQLLLDGMDGIGAAARGEVKETCARLASLPMKFHNAALHFAPSGHRLLDFLHWPAVIRGKYRWLQFEIAQEAMLARTDRELIFISEEKPWSWFHAKPPAKYGNIVTTARCRAWLILNLANAGCWTPWTSQCARRTAEKN